MPDSAAPDHFVIVGAQRCGTTYLYRLLEEHPEIEMAKPLRPEPKFFLDDSKFPLGLGYYNSQFFSDANASVRGEKSTSYIESDLALQRISAMMPAAPIVVVIRDPVHRAISNVRFSVQSGAEHLPMAEALRAATGQREWDPRTFSVSPFDYLARGRYADYLERAVKSIERDRIHVLVFEELVSETDVLARLYESLGVDPTFRPSAFHTAVNASDTDNEPVDPEIRDWLCDYFREPNQRLEAFLGRQLPWP
jgi:hypothetical protein